LGPARPPGGGGTGGRGGDGSRPRKKIPNKKSGVSNAKATPKQKRDNGGTKQTG